MMNATRALASLALALAAVLGPAWPARAGNLCGNRCWNDYSGCLDRATYDYERCADDALAEYGRCLSGIPTVCFPDFGGGGGGTCEEQIQQCEDEYYANMEICDMEQQSAQMMCEELLEGCLLSCRVVAG